MSYIKDNQEIILLLVNSRSFVQQNWLQIFRRK